MAQATFFSGNKQRKNTETRAEAHALAAYHGRPEAAAALHQLIAAYIQDSGYGVYVYSCRYSTIYRKDPKRAAVRWDKERASSLGSEFHAAAKIAVIPDNQRFIEEKHGEIMHALYATPDIAKRKDAVERFRKAIKEKFDDDFSRTLAALDLPISEAVLREQDFPEEILNPKTITEGAKSTVVVNRYERNPDARLKCIEKWGIACVACGFNFENFYGNRGGGYIHVHHLKPLAEIGEEYELDPINDLRPICPNCHAMIHRSIPAISIEKLKEILLQAHSSNVVGFGSVGDGVNP